MLNVAYVINIQKQAVMRPLLISVCLITIQTLQTIIQQLVAEANVSEKTREMRISEKCYIISKQEMRRKRWKYLFTYQKILLDHPPPLIKPQVLDLELLSSKHYRGVKITKDSGWKSTSNTKDSC